MNRLEVRAARMGVLGGIAILVTACGGGSSTSSTTPTSYIGTTGAFTAAADPNSESSVLLVSGAAGKRQYLRGTVDLVTGQDVGQPTGIEMYKNQDGHIYTVDMTAVGAPVPAQVSSETAATVDDACTFGGAALPGATSDYTGVYAAPDFATPVHYAYFYRLPGSDGVCNSADDVIHMVHPNMRTSDSPLVAAAMPAASAYDPSTGAVRNFIAKMGTDIVALDPNGANPVSLATFGVPIQVLTALPTSNANSLPTGGLFIVDGDIVHVNYGSGAVSGSLFTIPNRTPHSTLSAAASPTTLYFSIVTPATGSSPASSTIYSMPLDGSAAAAPIDTEVGTASELTYPPQSNRLLFAVSNGAPSYAVKAISSSGGAPTTLVTINQNAGRFVASALAVYYTSYQVTGNNSIGLTRSRILSGIVATDGTEIVPPTANSEFMTGGQQTPTPAGVPLWAPAPIAAVLRIRNLTATVTAINSNGVTITMPGLSGGLVESIDTGSNQVTASIGTMPTSNATYLTDSFRVIGNVGYVDATNDASTQNPGTRDLYLLKTGATNSLIRVTNNL
jgi:hypothetical protein